MTPDRVHSVSCCSWPDELSTCFRTCWSACVCPRLPFHCTAVWESSIVHRAGASAQPGLSRGSVIAVRSQSYKIQRSINTCLCTFWYPNEGCCSCKCLSSASKQSANTTVFCYIPRAGSRAPSKSLRPGLISSLTPNSYR